MIPQQSTTTCKSCGKGNCCEIIDLGLQPLANNLLSKEDLEKPEPRFPLNLTVCKCCWLMQIQELVPPTQLFSEYLYFSSISDALLEHSKSNVEQRIREEKLDGNSLVVEIASNDGYLLQNYQRLKIPCLGIEPAANIAKVARDTHGIETIVDFFGLELAQSLTCDGRQADLIHANNVFAHVPDTNDFVAGVSQLLKPTGLAVFEFPYGVEMIEQNEFDTIYHEHVFYFTLTALRPLLLRHNLEAYHVERHSIHGGTLRLFICQQGSRPIQESVNKLQKHERDQGIDTPDYYKQFASNISKIRHDLTAKIAELKSQGKSIAAYGASAKGSTLLNYFNLPTGSLDFVVDRSSAKQGRFSPGLHLPILAPEALLQRQPDYALLLTWNFKEEIFAQQHEYRKRGGKFIIPIPSVSIY